jgi:hypothetical protein
VQKPRRSGIWETQSMKHITIGFSIHRPEIIEITADLMQRHEVIFLEEPPAPGLKEMLEGVLPVDDYLLPAEVEYPEFSRSMCRLLRELYRKGKTVIQVEPFLENLLAIHTFFSQDHRPDELKPRSLQHQVYLAEKEATRALLDYYQTVMNGSFSAAIEAIIEFARVDAARFRLRDRLRADALATHLSGWSTAYIEAGAMHYAMYPMIRKRMPGSFRIKPVFLAHRALQTLGAKGHLFGPGDQLTLMYLFHPEISGTLKEALLAARALIYTKLIEKEELSADLKTFPHVRNELACIRSVEGLGLNDCERLFPLIRRVSSADARIIVDDYFRKVKKQPRQSIHIQSFYGLTKETDLK